MTEQLRTLMDQRASRLDFPVPDFAEIRSAGLRRRRRRRYAGAAVGGAAAVALVVVVSLTATGVATDSDTGPDFATDPPPRPGLLAPSYAVDDVIHDRAATIDVGHPVKAYVRTSVGFVTADDQGRVWSVTDGTVEQIGTTDADDLRLVSDPYDTRAAWVDDQDPTTYVVHDQSDGAETTYEQAAADSARVYALSDDRLYVRDGDQAVAIDLQQDRREVIDTGVSESTDVLDAAAGTVAFSDSAEGGQVSLGPTRNDAGVPFDAEFGRAILSPDATYLAFGNDEGGVYDTATGERADLGLGGFYEPVEWWDATTLAVIAGSRPDGGGAVRVLGCDVVAGRCEVALSDLGTFADLDGHFALPGVEPS